MQRFFRYHLQCIAGNAKVRSRMGAPVFNWRARSQLTN
jgi:hypothetical protein